MLRSSVTLEKPEEQHSYVHLSHLMCGSLSTQASRSRLTVPRTSPSRFDHVLAPCSELETLLVATVTL